ncbi:MAG: thioredoxin-disulfide reductase [Spirochaetales bacterium]|nr:thioredoxin-disulfide reductase [Spirochaetales bacterium]
MKKTDRDLIIIGAGAAGLSAAQYGARSNLNVVLIEEMAAGGQAMIIDNLENYPGFNDPVPGYIFSQKMEDQAKKFGAEIISDSVQEIKKENNIFVVKTYSGEITASTVIISTGAKHRTLKIPGEKEFAGKGVSYCATCDGPFFKGQKMIVVGGGDAACDESMFLSKLSDKIILVHRRDKFRAQKSLASRVLGNKNIEVRFNTEIKDISGDTSVKRVTLFNNKDERDYIEDVNAVFVFVGSIPQTKLIKDLSVEVDEGGYIKTNNKMETTIRGLFAAGDVRDTPFRQLIVAASEGAIAAHSASQYIDELKGEAYV